MDVDERLVQVEADIKTLEETKKELLEEKNKTNAKLVLLHSKNSSHGMAGVRVTQDLIDQLSKYIGQEVGIGIIGNNYLMWDSCDKAVEQTYFHLSAITITS